MGDWPDLPFKVGDLAEARSFQVGFRGAWFRCKVQRIYMRPVQGPQYYLEYYDFPEEKVIVTKLYQKPSRNSIPTLILRPQYPPIYNERKGQDANSISELIVVQDDIWKVGDEVDWFTKGCFWSGRVTKILTKDRVQIMLPPPPAGEGSTYDVDCKDLRPSLNWSLEHGWSVPIFKEGENFRTCARLIDPADKGPQLLEINTACETATDLQSLGALSDSSFSFDTSSSSSSSSLEVDKPNQVTHQPDKSIGPITGIDGIAKTNCSDSVSTSHIKDVSAQTNGDDDILTGGPMKRMKTDCSVSVNSTQSDTLEATFLDLEELVNKIKWLKGILTSSSSDAHRPPWKFLNCPASPISK